MKLEVGMYVKTNLGKIAKVEEIEDNLVFFDNYLWSFYEDETNFIHLDNEMEVKRIVKTSYNIIDLIEVGDYVNGALVSDITGEYLYVGNEAHNKFYFSKQIKSIVTKKQFENISYKVGKDL